MKSYCFNLKVSFAIWHRSFAHVKNTQVRFCRWCLLQRICPIFLIHLDRRKQWKTMGRTRYELLFLKIWSLDSYADPKVLSTSLVGDTVGLEWKREPENLSHGRINYCLICWRGRNVLCCAAEIANITSRLPGNGHWSRCLLLKLRWLHRNKRRYPNIGMSAFMTQQAYWKKKDDKRDILWLKV